MVQDTWDTARKITCDWQSKLEKMVTFSPFSVAELQQVAEVKFAGSGDNVRTRMEIQFGRGPFAAPLEGLTKIGDELTVVIYVEDGGAGYDMMVKNCYAYDSRNFKRANKIRLLNDHGCLFRPHQMEYFQRTFDTRATGADLIGYARMNAFKFPDKMDVFLSCELELCKGGCDTHCEMDDYPIDITDRVDRAESRALPDTVAVPVRAATTFRPAEVRKVLRGVKRLRKPKDFSPHRVRDDAAAVLSPPQDLSPDLIQLLEELGAEPSESKASLALPQKTERPTVTEGMLASPSTLVYAQSERPPAPLHVDSQPDIRVVDSAGGLLAGTASAANTAAAATNVVGGNNGLDTAAAAQTDNADTDQSGKKMSFSTIFAGTHTISNTLPPTIINNDANFKPSQLLSASMDTSPPFPASISAFSKGNSGNNNVFPPRLDTQSIKANDVLEEASGPAFSPNTQFINFPADKGLTNSNNINGAPANSINSNNNNNNIETIKKEISIANKNLDTLGININTLQQQLQAEGFNCGAGSTDPKCSPQNNLIRGGFQPLDTSPTTPNIFSTTLVFTSPRSVELLTQKLAKNPGLPKQVVMKVVDGPQVGSDTRGGGSFRPPRNLRNNPRYGARLAYNKKRFANILGSAAGRKRRDVGNNVFGRSDDEDYVEYDDINFPRETVNMIKNFQVVSASDLAFDTASLHHRQQLSELVEDFEAEICFEETAFYSGLLVTCSLLLLSGLVSICSIKRVRKYQTERNKKFFFGSEVLDSYQ